MDLVYVCTSVLYVIGMGVSYPIAPAHLGSVDDGLDVGTGVCACCGFISLCLIGGWERGSHQEVDCIGWCGLSICWLEREKTLIGSEVDLGS